MTPKGKLYATCVRRAGLAWSQGDAARAIAAIEEGLALAQEHGDMAMVQVLQQDLARYRGATIGEAIELSSGQAS